MELRMMFQMFTILYNSYILNIQKYLINVEVFSLIKQRFILLLSFREPLATKYLSLNDQPCMFRPTLIDLNHVELKYYPFMISLDKCNGRCNVVFPEICVPKKTKAINVEVFNTIKNKNEAKTMKKHVSCDCKCKFYSTICNSNQKWNKKTYQSQCKNYPKCKKYYSKCICENSKYSKRITDTSVIVCDEIISVMDIASTEMSNTMATNQYIVILKK